jgi:hypothetical protein
MTDTNTLAHLAAHAEIDALIAQPEKWDVAHMLILEHLRKFHDIVRESDLPVSILYTAHSNIHIRDRQEGRDIAPVTTPEINIERITEAMTGQSDIDVWDPIADIVEDVLDSVRLSLNARLSGAEAVEIARSYFERAYL